MPDVVTKSFLFVMWSGGGNVNPFLGLAEPLLARGHRVGAVASAALHSRLRAAGIDIVGTGEAFLPGADDVIAGADSYAPDVVIVDYMLISALCGAERAGRPTVALVHTLYLDLMTGDSPFPMWMTGPPDSVNETRAALGLASIGSFGALLEAVDLVLVTAPRELDGPGDVPSNVAYVGALFEGADSAIEWQPPAGDGPLVVVSLGTAGDDADAEREILTRIVAALGALAVRGLVTVPGYIDAAALDAPTNVTVSSYVPHAAVFPHTDLFVTHAGLGSVVAALAYGVPMVCLPLGREQPQNAHGVERIGAGRVVSRDASTEELGAAIAGQLRVVDRVRIEPDPQRAVAHVEALAR